MLLTVTKQERNISINPVPVAVDWRQQSGEASNNCEMRDQENLKTHFVKNSTSFVPTFEHLLKASSSKARVVKVTSHCR